MQIIAVDDERMALEVLADAIREAAPEASLSCFRSAEDALAHAKEHPLDVAFLDINLRGQNGIETARTIKRLHPQANIIFTTGYSEYMGDAFAMHASGYLLKPVTEAMIREELAALRNPVRGYGEGKRVRAQAFGNFEIFVDGKPVHFQYSKTKELLAWLIDRNGALATNGELLSVLWEDEDDVAQHASYLKNLRADLVRTLEELNCGQILTRQRGKIGVVPSEIACDYYAWLDGEAWAINAYRGEYMAQYSWSEYTLGTMEHEYSTLDGRIECAVFNQGGVSMRALIICKDQNMNEDVRMRLAGCFPDAEWLCLTDPFLAAKRVCNEPFDLMICGLGVRKVTGLRLMRVVRAQKPDLPVVMADAGWNGRAQALASGADGCICLGDSDAELKSTIKHAMLSEYSDSI